MKNIKWIQQGQKYFLKNDEALLLTLNIHPTIGADFKLNNKTYEICTKGNWNPTWCINVDGTEIVKLISGFWSSKGKIMFSDGTEYSNEFTSKGGLKMRFLDSGNEILSYEVVFENKRPALAFTLGIEMVDAEKLLILAAFGMTIFSNIFKEMAGDSDTTTISMLSTILTII
jgi:hypothetical protein